MNQAFETSVERLALVSGVVLAGIVARKLLLASIILTAIFCFPSLINESRHAGFMYTGDILGYYWPFLERVNELLGNFTFGGLDIGHYNGSSELFLTSNVYPVHPLFSLYSILPFSEPSFQQLGNVLVWMIAFHFFIFFYFTARLITEFTTVHYSVALVGAAVAAFSQSAIYTLGEPEFIFSISSVSWCIYASLNFARYRNFLMLPLAAVPTVLFIVGGYVPLGVSALFLAVAAIFFYIVVVRTELVTLADKIRALALAALPIAIGLMVCAPFLWASYVFLQASPSAGTASLFYSAHQLTELPQTVIRVLSFSLTAPGPFYELSMQLGLIPVAIIVLFLTNRSASRLYTDQDWNILKFGAAAYATTALSVYGVFSPISDLIYYLVPQVGKMHIYQRFLLPAQLLVGIILAIILHSLLRQEHEIAFGKIATVSFVFTLAVAFFVGRYPAEASSLGLNNALIFELLSLSFFIAALAMPGLHFKSVVALCLICLPSLGTMYNWSRDREQAQKMVAEQPLFLDSEYQKNVAAFMRQYTDKDLIKYEDTTTRWDPSGRETFPKSFPYLMSNVIDLSSYGGFNFYLAARQDYSIKMPYEGAGTRQTPDWEWLKATGADFIVAPNEDLERLQSAGYISGTAGSFMQLPQDVILAPLSLGASTAGRPTVFDNGYLRVSEDQGPANAAPNLALNQPAAQSGTFGGMAPGLAVDGNTDGQVAGGSISHTTRNDNAWWEVDLGSAQTIGDIKIAARADCCRERRENIWVLVSSTPFGAAETADQARGRSDVWSRLLMDTDAPVSIPDAGVQGRYVRFQFDGAPRGEAGYMSLAEVQVLAQVQSPPAPLQDGTSAGQVRDFQTDKAGWIWADIAASTPLKVDYLFWYNPRLRFLVDGQDAELVDNGGLKSILIPTGEHTLEVKVVNTPLALFWVLYGLFWVVVLISVVFAAARTLAGSFGRPGLGLRRSP